MCIRDRDESEENEGEPEKKLIFLHYRGKATENFERALTRRFYMRIHAACKIITTIKKIETVLPLLKAPVKKVIKSGLVYQISCSRCQSCYVGQTTRHLLTRVKEHRRIGTPVGNHFKGCGATLIIDDVKVIVTSTKSVFNLMTHKALYILSLIHI